MKNVPKLRFKEFNEEWEERKLENLCEDFIVPMRDKPKDLTGVIPWCRIEDFSGKYLLTSKTNQGVSEETIKKMNLKVFPVDTLLVSCSANLGKCAIIKKRLITNQTFIGLIPKKNKVSIEFFYYLMLLQERKLNLMSSGTTISYLSKDEFKNLKVLFSLELKEQEKIAEFLSSVDKKISFIEEKLNLFKEYKKGMMQKIFSQQLRFKDENGNNYPEWEEKKLGDILIKNKEKNKENKYNLVQTISNKYGFINQDEYFENRKVASKNLKNYYIAKNKLFAYNPSRINVGSLAYKKDNNISVISPLYVSFYTQRKYLVDIFLLNWLFSLSFIKQMSCSFEGSVRDNLSYEALCNFIISLPCLKEQEKIASFLSVVDNKIEKISDELKNLKEFKKGLLQQMFV